MFLKKFENGLKSLNLKRFKTKEKKRKLPASPLSPFQPGLPTGPVSSPAAAHLPFSSLFFLSLSLTGWPHMSVSPSIPRLHHFLCLAVRRRDSRRAWLPPPLSLPA
jgi:hypothetical protein